MIIYTVHLFSGDDALASLYAYTKEYVEHAGMAFTNKGGYLLLKESEDPQLKSLFESELDLVSYTRIHVGVDIFVLYAIKAPTTPLEVLYKLEIAAGDNQVALTFVYAD